MQHWQECCLGFACRCFYMTSSRCTTTNTCLVFPGVASAQALDHQPLFTEHNDVTALNGAVDDEGKWRGQRERGRKTRQRPFIMQSGVCVCEVQWVYAPAYIGVKMLLTLCWCVCVCVFKTCAWGCVCVFVHHGAHVNTCAYLCGRTGPAFDKRGSVCPVVKYGDER